MKTINNICIILILSLLSMSCESKKNTANAQSNVCVEMKTTLGNITVKLYNETPAHRDNFIKLVKEGYYDGTLFHRVINQFMIQGGDGDSRNATPDQQLGMGDPGYKIPAEFVYPQYFHKKGSLAAARRDEIMNMRRNRDQAGLMALQEQLIAEAKQKAAAMGPIKFTQEQIDAYTTVGGAPHLDGEYTVFGEVVEGMDVVEKIEKVETGSADRPKTDVKVISMKIVK
ncbi:MAG: peptidylprolyl isomerase [Bacteroidaceae bacterium]|nr:peptidylprolyl isomerase [Bacteroidaceae bacterium]